MDVMETTWCDAEMIRSLPFSPLQLIPGKPSGLRSLFSLCLHILLVPVKNKENSYFTLLYLCKILNSRMSMLNVANFKLKQCLYVCKNNPSGLRHLLRKWANQMKVWGLKRQELN